MPRLVLTFRSAVTSSDPILSLPRPRRFQMLLEELHPLLPSLVHLPHLRLPLTGPDSKPMLGSFIDHQLTFHALLCLPFEDRPDYLHLRRGQLYVLAAICIAYWNADGLNVIRYSEIRGMRGVSLSLIHI